MISYSKRLYTNNLLIRKHREYHGSKYRDTFHEMWRYLIGNLNALKIAFGDEKNLVSKRSNRSKVLFNLEVICSMKHFIAPI